MPAKSAVNELLTRAVSDLVPRKVAEAKLASGKPIRLYLGIDPTGAKLHLGHSVPLRKLKAFSEAGHQVIFLIGSFTAMIGDPSGRDNMREPLTPEQIEENFKTYKAQAEKILDFSKIEIRYNHEWLSTLTFADVVQLAGHFTVQQMLERDMFQQRMKAEKPIHLHEFFYPLMQGYDSVAMDVDAEVGGNDQLFNMLAGRTLLKELKQKEKFVLTTKLINGTDGRKMSKTYDNCVYLDDGPTQMFGKLMSIGDDLITEYMECCTDIAMTEIAAVTTSMKKGDNPKDHKVRLAREVVTLYHGAAAADTAVAEFQRVFGGGGLPDEVPSVTAKKGTALLDLLVAQKLAPSKTEARRLFQQGGVKLDDVPVTDPSAPVQSGILRVGKRKFLKITAQ